MNKNSASALNTFHWRWKSNPDDEIARLAMLIILRATERLRAATKPLSYGAGEGFRQYVPTKTPEEILNSETSPCWFGYAEALRDFIAELQTTPITPFIAKKKGRTE